MSEFQRELSSVFECTGLNIEMTSSADFNGPVFVCPLLFVGQTAVKHCLKKNTERNKPLLHRNQLAIN